MLTHGLYRCDEEVAGQNLADARRSPRLPGESLLQGTHEYMRERGADQHAIQCHFERLQVKMVFLQASGKRMVNSSTCATATRRPSGCLGLPAADITCLRMVRRTARRGNRGSRTGGQRLSAKGMVDELSQISGQERVYGGRGGDSTHGGVKASWSLMQIDGPGCRITSLEVNS